jgi:hypothetical protein
LSHVRVTYKTDFGLDDWIYCTSHIHNWGLQAIQRYRYATHFAVHRYTRTRVLSLHKLCPDNGFISLTVTAAHMQSSFHLLVALLGLILRPSVPKTRLSSIPLLLRSYPCRLAVRSSTLHFRLDYTTAVLYSYFLVASSMSFITSRHGPYRKHSLYG